MSTSPSWFDQEKFSRLVKKVGPKPASESTTTAQLPPDAAERLANLGRGAAQRSPSPKISLASKPPTLLAEPPTRPTLPRRTSPLPALEALYRNRDEGAAPEEATEPEVNASTPVAPAEPPEGEAPVSETAGATPPDTRDLSAVAGEDLAAAWQKITQLHEEVAHTVQDLNMAMQERDQAMNENTLLRDQLSQADQELAARPEAGAPSEDVATLTQERNEALAESNRLREQLGRAEEALKKPAVPSNDLTILTNERDVARKDYAKLRAQFEAVKQEQARVKDEADAEKARLQKELDAARKELEDRGREMNAVKVGSLGADDAADKLKQESEDLKAQVAKAKDEASVAQRGLALSQKALQDTRLALREATEGSSMARTNMENLKNECSTLVQQNMLLQAQYDQLARELSAFKAKATSRL